MLNLGTVAVVGTPQSDLTDQQKNILSAIFKRFVELGIIVRTAGSEGIETMAVQQYKAYLDSGKISPAQIEMYLPWHRYNSMISASACYHTVTVNNFVKASSFIKLVKSNWSKGTHKTKLMQAKNAFLIFGRTLDKPVDFVISSTPFTDDNMPLGLPSSALLLARLKKIPVFNFYESSSFEETFLELQDFLIASGCPIKANALYGSRTVAG